MRGSVRKATKSARLMAEMLLKPGQLELGECYNSHFAYIIRVGWVLQNGRDRRREGVCSFHFHSAHSNHVGMTRRGDHRGL